MGKVQLNLTNGIDYNILIEGVSGGFNGVNINCYHF